MENACMWSRDRGNGRKDLGKARGKSTCRSRQGGAENEEPGIVDKEPRDGQGIKLKFTNARFACESTTSPSNSMFPGCVIRMQGMWEMYHNFF